MNTKKRVLLSIGIIAVFSSVAISYMFYLHNSSAVFNIWDLVRIFVISVVATSAILFFSRRLPGTKKSSA